MLEPEKEGCVAGRTREWWGVLWSHRIFLAREVLSFVDVTPDSS